MSADKMRQGKTHIGRQGAPSGETGGRAPATGTITGDDMKITGEVFQVGGGGLTSPEDAAIYLVRFGESAALVDAGCGYGVERLLKNIRHAGVEPAEIEFLLITHCHFDHTGGAAALKKRLGCKVVAHQLDAPYLETGDNGVTAASWYGATIEPFSVDRKLTGAREEIRLGGENHPGHPYSRPFPRFRRVCL